MNKKSRNLGIEIHLKWNAMTEDATGIEKKLRQRAMRKTQKRDAKRLELANSAVSALCSLGYANTSLRDIAEVSGHPLGTFTYYFDGRQELIIFCVQQHKIEFLDQMRKAALAPGTLDEVIYFLSQGLTKAVIHDSHRHRLWFDIRNQSVFDPSLRPIIEEIEKESISILKVIEQRFLTEDDGENLESATINYAAIDGLFRHMTQEFPLEASDPKTIQRMFTSLLRSLWRSRKSV